MARAVAIAGMVMVHFGPSKTPDTLAGDLYSVSSGRASVLFALLAGVSVSLLAATRAPNPAPAIGRRSAGNVVNAVDEATAHSGARNHTRIRLVLRALPLLPLGLWLQQLDHDALVILQYYSLYFLMAAAVLGLSNARLLQTAGMVLIFGPLMYLLAATARPGWMNQLPAALTDDPVRIGRDLLLSGAYPLVTWAVPVLFGMWLGRQNLHSSGPRLLLLAGGAAVTIGAAAVSIIAAIPALEPASQAYSFLLSSKPHGQSPIWMAGSIGSACAVLGLVLFTAGATPRMIWPLAAAGQLALTIYVGHIVGMDLTGELLERDQIEGASLTVAAFMAAAVAFSVAYRRLFRRGPLETLLALPWEAVLALHRRAGKTKQGRDGRL